MSTAKSFFDKDTEANSLLNVTTITSARGPGKKNTPLYIIRERYRKEYLEFHAEKQLKMTERMMRLDYVIKSANEFNSLLSNIKE